jgi:hypothetical protein
MVIHREERMTERFTFMNWTEDQFMVQNNHRTKKLSYLRFTNDTYSVNDDNILTSEEIILNDPSQSFALVHRLYHSTAFRVFCVCGIASVVVDLDHLTAWHRGIHIPAVLIALVTFLVLCTVYGHLISRGH